MEAHVRRARATTLVRLAVFDLDGTVLAGNSWRAYYRATAPTDWRLLGLGALRAAGFLNGGRFRESAVAGLAGASRNCLQETGERLLERHLLGAIRDDARLEVAARRTAGFHLLLLTAAWEFLAQPVARVLGFDAVLATELEFKDGRATGRLAGPEVVGLEKRVRLQAAVAGLDVDWRNSCAFGDSESDLEVMRLVGERVGIAGGDWRPGRPPPADVSLVVWS